MLPALSHVDTWIFDLDNTLYPVECQLFEQVDRRMTAFIADRFAMPEDAARKLQKDYWKRYGTTLTAHMDKLGLVNERFVVAHGVWLDNDDMKRLGDRGASVSHNPGSNMRLGNGLADVRGMLSAKVNVGVGTDGANCSDNLNMYEAMRLASFASKVQGPDVEKWLTTDEALRAATVVSAELVVMDHELGRIAPGLSSTSPARNWPRSTRANHAVP